MNELTNAEWAWAAGLFEGEGCVSSHQQRGATYYRLVLRMTDEDVVRQFHAGMCTDRIDQRKPQPITKSGGSGGVNPDGTSQ